MASSRLSRRARQPLRLELPQQLGGALATDDARHLVEALLGERERRSPPLVGKVGPRAGASQLLDDGVRRAIDRSVKRGLAVLVGGVDVDAELEREPHRIERLALRPEPLRALDEYQAGGQHERGGAAIGGGSRIGATRGQDAHGLDVHRLRRQAGTASPRRC